MIGIGLRWPKIRPEAGAKALILFLGLSLSACTAMLSWADGQAGAEGPVVFPDLSQLPTSPGPPPTEEIRSATVQTLEAARSQNNGAGENLDSQIENEFEYPSSSTN